MKFSYKIFLQNLRYYDKIVIQMNEKLTMIAMRTFRPPFFLRLFVRSRFCFRFPLKLLHFRPLILKPNLNDANAETRVLCQGLSYLPARLWRDFKGRFELSPLSRREYGPWPFRSPSAISWPIFIQ